MHRFTSIPTLIMTASAAVMTSCASAGPSERIDPVGDTFQMQRCVNMGNSLENPPDADWGGGWGGGGNIGAEDFERIKAKGFDTVRIPVRWNAYAGNGPDYSLEPAFIDHVRTIVDAALAEDLNVILNIHHFEEMMSDPEAEMPKFEALWKQIAEQFVGYPDTLWFETLNEPSGALEGDLTRQSQRVAIAAIRETHPERIIILGGDRWSGYRTLDTNIEPTDANIVYTFHYYDPFDFTHYLAEWTRPNMPDTPRGWGSAADRAELSEAIQHVVEYRSSIQRPVFMGEFGAYTTLEEDDRNRWIQAVRRRMEAADIPWCLWAYANTFAVYDADAGRWNEATLEALGLNE